MHECKYILSNIKPIFKFKENYGCLSAVAAEVSFTVRAVVLNIQALVNAAWDQTAAQKTSVM